MESSIQKLDVAFTSAFEDTTSASTNNDARKNTTNTTTSSPTAAPSFYSSSPLLLFLLWHPHHSYTSASTLNHLNNFALSPTDYNKCYQQHSNHCAWSIGHSFSATYSHSTSHSCTTFIAWLWTMTNLLTSLSWITYDSPFPHFSSYPLWWTIAPMDMALSKFDKGLMPHWLNANWPCLAMEMM